MKTYLGGVGLMLSGLGGILHGDISIAVGVGMIATGLMGIGARHFGEKVLDVIKTFQK